MRKGGRAAIRAKRRAGRGLKGAGGAHVRWRGSEAARCRDERGTKEGEGGQKTATISQKGVRWGDMSRAGERRDVREPPRRLAAARDGHPQPGHSLHPPIWQVRRGESSGAPASLVPAQWAS